MTVSARLQIDVPGPIAILRLIHLHLDLFTLHRQPDPHPNRLGRANRLGRKGARIVAHDAEDVFPLDAHVLDVFWKVGRVDDEAVRERECVGRTSGDAVSATSVIHVLVCGKGAYMLIRVTHMPLPLPLGRYSCFSRGYPDGV